MTAKERARATFEAYLSGGTPPRDEDFRDSTTPAAESSETTSDPERGPSVRLLTALRGPTAELRVSLDEFKKRKYLALRQWNKSGDRWLPDPRRGLSIKLREMEGLLAAINKAIELTRKDGQE
jgi:hypothetical protein